LSNSPVVKSKKHQKNNHQKQSTPTLRDAHSRHFNPHLGCRTGEKVPKIQQLEIAQLFLNNGQKSHPQSGSVAENCRQAKPKSPDTVNKESHTRRKNAAANNIYGETWCFSFCSSSLVAVVESVCVLWVAGG
jgi:hypothetical protein